MLSGETTNINFIVFGFRGPYFISNTFKASTLTITSPRWSLLLFGFHQMVLFLLWLKNNMINFFPELTSFGLFYSLALQRNKMVFDKKINFSKLRILNYVNYLIFETFVQW